MPEFSSVSEFLIAQAAQQAGATLPWSGLILEAREEPRRSISREQAAAVGELLWTSKHTDVRARAGAIAIAVSNGYFSLAAKDEETFRAIATELAIVDDDWDFFSLYDA